MIGARPHRCFCSRRHFLQAHAFGLGSVALSWLLKQDGLLGAELVRPELAPHSFDLKPKPTHYTPRARAMISLLMIGGPSQIDLFDPKPILAKYDGEKFPGNNLRYDNAAEASSKVFASPFKFSPRGQSGMELSELLPQLGDVADDLCLVRSMRTAVNNHGQSMYALNNGRITAGRPALGSWLTYGLGCESQDLPAYMALTSPHGQPLLAGDNWTSGWLPAIYQGTIARPTEPRILNLDPPEYLRGAPQEQQLEFLQQLNREHSRSIPGNWISRRASRVTSWRRECRRPRRKRSIFRRSRRQRRSSTDSTVTRRGITARVASWPDAWSSAASVSCRS
jgi:hypothetical protein